MERNDPIYMFGGVQNTSTKDYIEMVVAEKKEF